MALADLLSNNERMNIASGQQKVKSKDYMENKIIELVDPLRNTIADWRENYDLFVDFMVLDNPSNFHLFHFQRVFLRAAARHRYLYATFPRAYSKSFLSVLVLMIRASLFPGCKLFITSGGKEQAAGIAKDKVEEIMDLIPGFKAEIDIKKTSVTKDMVVYVWKNKSTIAIVANKQSSRGKRKTGGLIEEVISVDGQTLNEVIIPTMNISRKLPDGSIDEHEIVNKSQIYITTAGWKNTFAYQKNLQIMIRQLVKPGEAMVLGGSWRIPKMEGLLSGSFVKDLKSDGTFNANSFSREYESEWSGDAENAFFASQVFEQCRTILNAEEGSPTKKGRGIFYVIGVDVGRKGCATEAIVIKCVPSVSDTIVKQVVNLYQYNELDFESQAIKLKQLYAYYKAERLVIDANGLGIGLIDYMVKPQLDPKTSEYLVPFGVFEDKDNFYKQYITPDTKKEAMYLMKASAQINTEAHGYVQSQMFSGKVKFLIDEREAKSNLMATKMGKELSMEARNELLRPYTMTTILKEQMLNLKEDSAGAQIILKQSSKRIPKDKFSAFEYGMYYIKTKEDRRKKKSKKFSLSDYMFYN